MWLNDSPGLIMAYFSGVMIVVITIVTFRHPRSSSITGSAAGFPPIFFLFIFFVIVEQNISTFFFFFNDVVKTASVFPVDDVMWLKTLFSPPFLH